MPTSRLPLSPVLTTMPFCGALLVSNINMACLLTIIMFILFVYLFSAAYYGSVPMKTIRLAAA